MQGLCRVNAEYMHTLCRHSAVQNLKTYYYESYFIKSMHLPYGHA